MESIRFVTFAVSSILWNISPLCSSSLQRYRILHVSCSGTNMTGKGWPCRWIIEVLSWCSPWNIAKLRLRLVLRPGLAKFSMEHETISCGWGFFGGGVLIGIGLPYFVLLLYTLATFEFILSVTLTWQGLQLSSQVSNEDTQVLRWWWKWVKIYQWCLTLVGSVRRLYLKHNVVQVA